MLRCLPSRLRQSGFAALLFPPVGAAVEQRREGPASCCSLGTWPFIGHCQQQAGSRPPTPFLSPPRPSLGKAPDCPIQLSALDKGGGHSCFSPCLVQSQVLIYLVTALALFPPPSKPSRHTHAIIPTS